MKVDFAESTIGLYIALYAYVVANVIWYCRSLHGARHIWVRFRRWISERRTPKKASSQWTNIQEQLARTFKAIHERRRLQRARSGLRSLAGICLISALVILGLGPANLPFTGFCFISGAAAIFTVNCHVEKLSISGVKLLYSLLMLVHVVSCVPYGTQSTKQYFATGIIGRFMSRLVCSLWALDFQLGVVWNLVFSVAFCILYATGPEGFGGGSETMAMAVQENIAREILMTTVIIVLLRERVISFNTDVRRLSEVQAFRTEGSAKTSLLKAMCDVVVLLDTQLRIAQPCPQLQHMLRTVHTLKGDTLHDFIPSVEDRQRFDLFMAAASAPNEEEDGEDLAEILNVHLRDRHGVDRRVELLRAKFLHLDGSVGYLLGIRSQVEDDPETARPLDSGGGDNEDLDTVSSVATLDQLISEDKVMVSFDAFKWTILDHSLHFGVLLGNLMVGSNLAEVIENGAEFYGWVQQCAMGAVYGERTPVCPVDRLLIRGKRSATAICLPIREVRIYGLPAKSYLDGPAQRCKTIVVSILFLTLRTKPLLRLTASLREKVRLIVQTGPMPAQPILDEATEVTEETGTNGTFDTSANATELLEGDESPTRESPKAAARGLAELL